MPNKPFPKMLLFLLKENIELDDSTTDAMNTSGGGVIPGLADESSSEGIPGNFNKGFLYYPSPIGSLKRLEI